MNLIFVGSGYVGLVSGIMLASLGINVTCIDNDQEKINLLKQGKLPLYEPGLDQYMLNAVERGYLSFANNYSEVTMVPDAVFITVGTPSLSSGDADLSYVIQTSFEAAQNTPSSTLIVIKSTVPPGTTEVIQSQLLEKSYSHNVISNPEFLREGRAIKDFIEPDRIVIGITNPQSQKKMEEIYKNFEPLLFTDPTTAELIKYASNSFLATKIAFINEMANICEKTGGDVDALAYGIGLDKRIGKDFLKVGPGFGGSCFPKDILALEYLAKKHNEHFHVLSAVIEANEKRKKHIVQKIEARLGVLKDKKISVLGLTFKAETDDIRSSPAIDIINLLLAEDAKIIAFDPEGMENARSLGLNIDFADSVITSAKDADCILILTEWPEFKNLDYNVLADNMKSKIIFDYRNILDISKAKAEGFQVFQLGKRSF